MRSSAGAFPTRREIVLIFLLFCVLLYTSSKDHVTSSFSSLLGSSEVQRLDEQQKPWPGAPVQDVAFPAPKLTWTEEGGVPETTMLAHAFGWTMFDNLYICNGTIFIVQEDKSKIPNRDFITSSGYTIHNGDEEKRKRLPSDKDLRIVTPAEAQQLFGTVEATRLDGMSWVNTDPAQFISHYFHWAAELNFGFWRTYCQLDPFITAEGQTTLPAPRRMLFRHTNSSKWRDYASMNQWISKGAFPSMTIETSENWNDMAQMGRPFVFERVILADRAAAMKGPYFGTSWRTASEAFIFRGSRHWWAPIRVNVLQFSGLASEWIMGPDPGTREDRSKFVITYISRQTWSRRKLIESDNAVLVEELEKLRDDYGYELNVVSMEKLSRVQQFQLAGRTTIMMGVHGNGLTSLVWMRPSPRATVIEFFFPKGFAFDYEWTTRALNMVHYGVWYNRTFTAPDTPRVPNYPKGFQGNEIPLDGRVVAELVQERLTLADDDDEEEAESY